MLVDRDSRSGSCLALTQRMSRRARLRVLLAEPPDRPLLGDVLAPGERVAALARRARCAARWRSRPSAAAAGRRSGVRWSIVTCAAVLGHRRDQRDGGRAAADDHDPLAGVVEVLGPVLRVDDRAGEALAAREVRGVALVVAVVAAGAEEPAGGQRAARSPVSVRSTSTVQRASSRDQAAPTHLVVVADVRGRCRSRRRSPAGRRGSRSAVGDRLLVPPRLELVAERVQVGVRADARVAEQVPGAAGRVAGLEDRVASCRVLAPQVVGGADAGDARRRRSGRRRARSRRGGHGVAPASAMYSTRR